MQTHEKNLSQLWPGVLVAGSTASPEMASEGTADEKVERERQ